MSTPIDPDALNRLADVAVNVGLNLQPGQDLILTAPAEALPLVRAVAAAAYRAGAGVVTPLLSDPGVTLARFEHGSDDSFDTAPAWLYAGMAEAYNKGAARMAIVGEDPMLLSEQDPEKVARAGKANSIAYKPALEKIANFAINWSIASYPTLDWAKRIFPDMADEDAVAALADAIFAASRVNTPDPVAAWADHNAALATRTKWLNDQRFSALHFTSPGTDPCRIRAL